MAEQEKAPKKKMSTGVKIAIGCGGLFVVTIIIVVILSIAGVAGLSKVANEVNEDIAESEQEKEEVFNNPSELGESVTVGDVEWVLTEAEDLGSTIKSESQYSDDCVAESGKFIKVTVKLTNNSSDMVSVSDLYLYDSEKREYVSSSDVSSCVEGDLFILDNINPGLSKTFTTVYEVPADSKDFRLKAGNLDMFSGEVKYISLGF